MRRRARSHDVVATDEVVALVTLRRVICLASSYDDVNRLHDLGSALDGPDHVADSTTVLAMVA